MLDALSLDQIRTFLAAADQGSFSAAGRKLGRAQSVVSQTLANLEIQLGLRLFDRSGRRPVLTAQGEALLRQAREVVGSMDRFKSSARVLAGGVEPELSIAVDVLYPIRALTCAVVEFSAAFPETPLRIYAEVLGGALQQVLDGRCGFCVMNSISLAPVKLATEPMCDIAMAIVAAASHPLARIAGRISRDEAARHVQLVLTDRSTLTEGRQFGVLGEKSWRLADLGAKHAFLRAGLGWGGMPVHMVEDELASGALKRLDIDGFDPGAMKIAMAAAWRIEAPPGQAGRWMIGRLTRGPDEPLA